MMPTNKNTKEYYIGFRGGEKYWVVISTSLKAARARFCNVQQVNDSDYVIIYRKQPQGPWASCII